MNLWKTASKPLFLLAPMDDVTDTVFRQVVLSCQRPDIFFTEFVSADGLFSPGKDKVIQKLKFSKEEKPIVAQLWGNNPDNFYKAAQLIAKLGFDGIDINFGCPDRTVISHNCGAAIILNEKLVSEIIRKTKEGAPDLPISIKTRLGLQKIVTDEWIPMLLSQPIDAITVHGRTAKEQSKVPAHWDEIGKAVKIRNHSHSNVLIIGNGDIESYDQGLKKIAEYELDGIMIGRGIFKDLWVFEKTKKEGCDTPVNKLRLLLKHIVLFKKIWGKDKSFLTIRKYVKIYVSGFDKASDTRVKLMSAASINELELTVKDAIVSMASC